MKACAGAMHRRHMTKSKPAIQRAAITKSASDPATLWVKLSPAGNDQTN